MANIIFDTTPTSGMTIATVVTLAGNTTIVGNKPSALQAGEHLLAILVAGNNSPGVGNFSLPAGFEPALFNNGAVTLTRTHILVGIKLAGGSEPANYTFGEAASTRDDLLLLIRVTGIDPALILSTAVVSASTPNANPWNVPSPTVDTVYNNDMLLSIVGINEGNVLSAGSIGAGQPSGMSLIYSNKTRTNSVAASLSVAFQEYPTPATTGAKTWNALTTANVNPTAISIVLKAYAPQSVSAPATIAPGDTVTLIPTGFAGALNSVTLTDLAGNSIVRTVTTNQFTMPAVASGTGIQFGTATLTATDGSTTAETESDYVAATGYAYVDIATLSPAANSLYTQLMTQGLTLTTNDQLYSSTASNTEIFDDTTASSDLPNITVWVIQDDGDVYEIAVTMGSGGIESVGITSPGITERGITTRGITSRGL